MDKKDESKQSEPARGLLNVREFAHAIGHKEATVRRKVLERAVEFVRIGRSIRFRPEVVDELIAACTVLPKEVSK